MVHPKFQSLEPDVSGARDIMLMDPVVKKCVKESDAETSVLRM